jgi:hypothetical protein
MPYGNEGRNPITALTNEDKIIRMIRTRFLPSFLAISLPAMLAGSPMRLIKNATCVGLHLNELAG